MKKSSLQGDEFAARGEVRAGGVGADRRGRGGGPRAVAACVRCWAELVLGPRVSLQASLEFMSYHHVEMTSTADSHPVAPIL